MDIFAQYRILDGGTTFGKNYFIFRATYFVDRNAGMPASKHFPDWRLREGALEQIHKLIQPSSMVVKKADCLDLPPLVKQTYYTALAKDQRRLYEDMKRDLIAYVGTDACVATLAITKALRLQQIVSGYISLTSDDGGDPRNVSIKDNPRAETLKELLSEITPGAKCLVWAVFRENYATIRKVCESLGVRYVEVHGEVTAANRQKAVDAFNNEEDVRVFIGHPGSAGIGINLVSASYSIFYSRNFSLENDLQAEARNYRGGSEVHEKVTRIDLVAKDTIDELISEALAKKQTISDKVLLNISEKL
jgi:SNF2 family DNA or RNA helicase